MNTFLNIIWFLAGGFLIVIFYLLGTLFLMLTIVGIPFGLQTFKLSGLALFPFGKQVVSKEHDPGCLSLVLNVLWLIIAGLEIALIHMILALVFALTLIGLPIAVQHIKLARLALTPFGYSFK
ncbi:MAG: YccF domain-containing protein [Cyclobacteriaceae bacterium]|nr:YccF domain-containing protein [Cyclobacteriaceae bacterium]